MSDNTGTGVQTAPMPIATKMDFEPRILRPSIRDNFAMAALPAVITELGYYGDESASAGSGVSSAEVARAAWHIADAMLAQREKKQ